MIPNSIYLAFGAFVLAWMLTFSAAPSSPEPLGDPGSQPRPMQGSSAEADNRGTLDPNG